MQRGNIEFNIQMLERLKRAIKNNKKLEDMPELFEEENEKEHPECVGSVFAGVLNQSIMYLREFRDISFPQADNDFVKHS